MATFFGIVIVILVLAVLAKLYSLFKDRVGFIINGLDNKFTIPEIKLLWEVSQICKLPDPNSLYFSLPSLTRCMTQINNKAAADGDDNSPKMQAIMSKLFAFRTKLQNESDQKKGLDSTMELDKGQRLRIIYPGKGVFVSEIVNNGSAITISMPKQKNMIPVPAEDWIGKTVSVYLWRNGDARYVFDTVVESHGIFLGKLSLHLKHSSNLIRTQKRQAVRAKCNIHANLYLVKNEVNVNYNAVETSPGLRCLLEDISEAGALIRIGGKGAPNMKIKLQFSINGKLILMFGVVRTVEYNQEINQTRLHFECIHIDPKMKNDILSYVYDMLPEAEKEVYDALTMTASDEADEAAEEKQKEVVEYNPADAVEDFESSVTNGNENSLSVGNEKKTSSSQTIIPNIPSENDEISDDDGIGF